MSGDAHVRICESLGVKFPRATRLAVIIGGSSGCGARSTTRARFSICSCNDGATRLQR